MPYRLTWENQCVTFEYYGVVTAEDIIESNKEVYGDARFDSLRWEIVLFDETESIAFKDLNVRLINYMDQAAARSNPRITVAFVGSSETMAKVETAYLATGEQSPWPVIEFSSREEAVKYILQQD